jgi:hypothetical protein
MERRERLIWQRLVVHLRNGGTSAREIHRELRGEIPLATIERILENRLKKHGQATQTVDKKWIPIGYEFPLEYRDLDPELVKRVKPITSDVEYWRLQTKFMGKEWVRDSKKRHESMDRILRNWHRTQPSSGIA